jgi:hypothetical protein
METKKIFCQFGDGGETKYVRSAFWVNEKKNVMSGYGHPLGSTLITQTECSISLIENPIHTAYEFCGTSHMQKPARLKIYTDTTNPSLSLFLYEAAITQFLSLSRI